MAGRAGRPPRRGRHPGPRGDTASASGAVAVEVVDLGVHHRPERRDGRFVGQPQAVEQQAEDDRVGGVDDRVPEDQGGVLARLGVGGLLQSRHRCPSAVSLLPCPAVSAAWAATVGSDRLPRLQDAAADARVELAVATSSRGSRSSRRRCGSRGRSCCRRGAPRRGGPGTGAAAPRARPAGRHPAPRRAVARWAASRRQPARRRRPRRAAGRTRPRGPRRRATGFRAMRQHAAATHQVVKWSDQYLDHERGARGARALSAQVLRQCQVASLLSSSPCTS